MLQNNLVISYKNKYTLSHVLAISLSREIKACPQKEDSWQHNS
jgi:hypothetical protein